MQLRFLEKCALEIPYLLLQRKCQLYGLCHRKRSHIIKNTSLQVSCSQIKVEDGIDDETCELVNGVELVIGESEDSIHAYLLKAVKNNNGTGVLLLSDIFGFEDSSTRDFAYRVACNGYNVLVPDLFRGNPWRKGQDQSEFKQWFSSLSLERVANDIAMATKWMADEFLAAGISKKLNLIGFCFGGRQLIEILARDKQAYFGTGACFYGTQMNSSLAAEINVPVLFICGDNDPFCPLSTVYEMEKRIEGSRVVVYNGRGHGFAHRPESPEEDEDAENAFVVMRHWLHDCLVVNKG